MTEISFGEVVAAVLEEISATPAELSWPEREDPDAAAQHYSAGVADCLRRLFDEVEARIAREKEEEKTRIQRIKEEEKSLILDVLKDIIEHEPEVREAVRKCMGAE